MSKEPSKDSTELEHDFAAVIRKMEASFPFDTTKAHALLAKLQSRKAKLEAELQAAFPLK